MYLSTLHQSLELLDGRAVKADPNRLMPERASALRLARRLGCEGAHEANGGWAPCPTPEALAVTIKHGTKGYERWKASNKTTTESRLAPHIKCWDNAQMRQAAVMERHAVADEYDDDVNPARFTRRQAALIRGLRSVADEFGKFDQSVGPNGAHYINRSPFAHNGMVCANCAFYEGPRGCEVVDGDIAPDAVCKLWVIPEDLIGEKMMGKGLGNAIGRMFGRGGRGKGKNRASGAARKVIKKATMDANARDADGDGFVQEGTTAMRRVKPSGGAAQTAERRARIAAEAAKFNRTTDALAKRRAARKPVENMSQRADRMGEYVDPPQRSKPPAPKADFKPRPLGPGPGNMSQRADRMGYVDPPRAKSPAGKIPVRPGGDPTDPLQERTKKPVAKSPAGKIPVRSGGDPKDPLEERRAALQARLDKFNSDLEKAKGKPLPKGPQPIMGAEDDNARWWIGWGDDPVRQVGDWRKNALSDDKFSSMLSDLSKGKTKITIEPHEGDAPSRADDYIYLTQRAKPDAIVGKMKKPNEWSQMTRAQRETWVTSARRANREQANIDSSPSASKVPPPAKGLQQYHRPVLRSYDTEPDWAYPHLDEGVRKSEDRARKTAARETRPGQIAKLIRENQEALRENQKLIRKGGDTEANQAVAREMGYQMALNEELWKRGKELTPRFRREYAPDLHPKPVTSEQF